MRAKRDRVRSFLGVLLLAASALAIAGCKHDLKALSKDYDELLDSGTAGKGGGSSGKGGSGGSSAGRGGSSGSGGSAGSTMTDGGPQLPCNPCEELSTGAKALGLRRCCRGVPAKECGLTVGEDNACLPQMVPGQPNDTCGDIRILGMLREGCCRPDGRCGVATENLGLGCVAREELAPLAADGGPAPMAMACDYTCTNDDECTRVLEDLVCAEPDEGTQRTCLPTCQNDAECPGDDELCSLTPDVGKNRFQNVCTPAVGDAVPGEACARISDCSHSICIVPEKPAEPYCSQLCRNLDDCPAGFKFCTDTDTMGAIMGTPGPAQTFKICRK